MNRAPVDGWTVVHALAGVAAYRAGLSLGRTVALGVVYELLEQAVEASPSGQALFGSDGPESEANAVTDVLVMAGAFMLARGRSRG